MRGDHSGACYHRALTGFIEQAGRRRDGGAGIGVNFGGTDGARAFSGRLERSHANACDIPGSRVVRSLQIISKPSRFNGDSTRTGTLASAPCRRAIVGRQQRWCTLLANDWHLRTATYG